MSVRKPKQSISKLSKKSQYNLDRKSAEISPLSSRNVGKYKLLKDEDVLSEIDFLEKAARIKQFEYSPLSSEWEKTDIAK